MCLFLIESYWLVLGFIGSRHNFVHVHLIVIKVVKKKSSITTGWEKKGRRFSCATAVLAEWVMPTFPFENRKKYIPFEMDFLGTKSITKIIVKYGIYQTSIKSIKKHWT